MQHGHFSGDRREFVITDPRCPRPWHNYLFNAEYLVNLTHLGTGSSFYQPSGEGLRANVTEDRDGNGGPRFVYLRDNDSGAYWSLTGAPRMTPVEGWQCRVGLGYQIMSGRVDGIAAAWRVLVPPGSDPCELWSVTVRNEGERPRRLSAIPYLEMHLTGGSTLMDFIAVLGGRYVPELRAVFGINSCVKFPPRFKALLASDSPVAGATVSRDEFLGAYRDYGCPLAVETGTVHNPEAGTEWLGASLRHELELAPGAERTVHCLVAAVERVEEGAGLIGKYLAAGAPDRVFGELRAAADRLTARNAIFTGDEQFDRWTNVWLKHQLRFVGQWGRVIGRGYRDILQDTFGHRLAQPETARACIREVFARQYPSGKCIRAWRLPTAQLDLQDYADSPSWMVMALSGYLKETGDLALLDEAVPFLNARDPGAAPDEEASVWDHVVRAQRHLLGDLGEHGLSRIHYGDWCDTMNGVGVRGRGESVMLSMQVKWGCDLLAELASRRGLADLAAEMAAAAAGLAAAIRAHAWNGEWFVRAFDDDGVAVGTPETADRLDGGEGRIFLNPQSWAIISGVADAGQAERCIAAARRHLDTGYGMTLNWPAYTGLKPRIGQMTAMTPGFYENGSVYVHGNCFWIQALARAGRGREAWDALSAILPDTANKPNGDTEPFVVPNYYIGPNHARRRQRNLYLSGWRTGSAAWLYMTCLEWILGLRAEYDGLRVEPRLPEGWKTCRVARSFRGDVYDVAIENPTGRGTTVDRLELDGRPVDGTLIPPVGDGARHEVRAVLRQDAGKGRGLSERA